MNGSFIIPTKYIRYSSNEKIWLLHSIIGCAIIPWIILFITMPHTIQNYALLNSNILIFLIFSGFVFGIGQMCFANAIGSIGIALSFVINLSIGVTIGSMFIVFYKGAFFTLQGYLVTLAVLLIISALLIHYLSGKKSNNQKNSIAIKHSHYHKGWLLASFTGITSGLQNITFVILAFYSTTQFQSKDSFWVWPPFLLSASLPMLIGFWYRIRKAQSKNIEIINFANKSLAIKNILLIIVMGLFFTGSLAIYSMSMSELSYQQQIIGWPVFMISIILVTQAWGWLYGESSYSTMRSKLYEFSSIILLIIAIIILAIEA